MSGPHRAPSSGFDKLAVVYRWLEYVTFGPLLQRCRVHFVPHLRSARQALLLGDGDGRFCAVLLAQAPQVHVTAVDGSARMLQAMRARVQRGGNRARLDTVHADAMAGLPDGEVDLICTHFFLDCLNDDEVSDLARRLRVRCPRGYWVISEFAVPPGAAGWIASALVGGLYLAFGMLTGLATRRLPQYAPVLRRNGFVCTAVHTRLFGLLRSELWRSFPEA